MSAGDLVNNLGKLELKLKQVNFRNFRRSELLSGTLDIYVSIYGYVFSDFNRELSKLIASHELELYGKTNKRFVDNLYLVVRDVLHYKPPINKDMFLTKCGFVEMKMIMCTQILELVLLKCKELPSSEKNKKNCRKPACFSSSSSLSSTSSTNNGKNSSIKTVCANKPKPKNDADSENNNNADCITISSTMSDGNQCDRRVVLGSPMKRKISTTEGKKTATKMNNLCFYSSSYNQPSNHSRLPESRLSSQISRPSNSSCAISQNPVSKCNIARSSYSKGKPVVLEKQEPPPQKVDVRVLKGPRRVNDGFSAVLRIIPPEELSRCRDISFCQNSFIPNTKNSNIESKNPTEQNSCITNSALHESDISTTTTTTPTCIENILSLLTSSTSRITKPQNVCSATIIPTSTSTTKLKCPLKETVPAESKFVKNITMRKRSDENSPSKEISFLTSESLHAGDTTKVDDPQSLKDLHDERRQATNVLTQIKNLSLNLTGCTETLRQMQGRSQQWETHSAFLNSFGQNKENTPALKDDTIAVELEVSQDGVGLSKTKENEDQTHQLDYWIAKMNLMECTVKSLESKFKSL